MNDIQNVNSSEFEEMEEELREQVNELPPKIEDMRVTDYDIYEDENDNPTVVIDSSLDEKDLADYRQKISEDNDDGANTMSNIQYALRSIQLQEVEESKKV